MLTGFQADATTLTRAKTANVKPLRSRLRLRILLRLLDRLSPNARGIVAMLGAMAAFAFGDALMKLSTGYLPAGESIFVRGIIASTLIWILAAKRGALEHLPRLLHPRLPLRTLGDMGGSFFYITALPHMPLAEAAAILQTNPLLVTAAAAIFLGEKVGWRRWSATAVGFVGALMIIQPGSSSFTWASVLVILALFFAVMRDVVTRKLIGIPVILITATAATCTMLASLAFIPFEAWQMPTAFDILRLSAAGGCMLAGQILVVISIQAGDVSAVVPFRYSAIVWTLLLSAAIWHYLPNALTMAGIFVVAAAGLYTFFREQTLRRNMSASLQRAEPTANPLPDRPA